MAGIVADACQVSEILWDVVEFAAQAIPGGENAGVTLMQSCDDAPRVQAWAVTASFVEPGHAPV